MDMKSLKFLVCVIVLSLSSAFSASPPPAADETPYAQAYKAGMDLEKAGKMAEARVEFQKALAMEGITPDQAGEALLKISQGHTREYQWQPANAALEKALALQGVSDALKIKAYLGVGTIWMNYGDWVRVKNANAAALGFANLLPEQKIQAQKAMVKALLNLREFPGVRTVLKELLATGEQPPKSGEQPLPSTVLKEYAAAEVLPQTERAALQIAIAKTFMSERNYAAARDEFVKAQAMPGLQDAMRAEIQLYLGLSFYEEGDYQRAKPELLKVQNLPAANVRPPWDGGRMGYVPGREAMLRLRLRNLAPDDQKPLKVLFIGSSHTLRGNIPELVTQMAASASEGQPRLIAGDYIRMGTGLKTFWDAGDTLDTARGVISAEPWDAVVFETFYNMSKEDILKYGSLISDLIRNQKAQPVIYETPIAKAALYPEKFEKFHADNLNLVKVANIPVAPSVAAWMKIFGPKPTPEQLAGLYDDWIHASPKGAYVTACCIYSALTGRSPQGLYHPRDIPAAEAGEFQRIAWEAYQEANKQ